MQSAARAARYNPNSSLGHGPRPAAGRCDARSYAPAVPGMLFHASPAALEPGAVLLPGRKVSARTVGDGNAVCLAGTESDAHAWATYLGRRLNLDMVTVYRVHVTELTRVRLDRRGALPLPQFEAAHATVVEACGLVDPWAGLSAEARRSLAAAPF